jgi:hypothetical protein
MNEKILDRHVPFLPLFASCLRAMVRLHCATSKLSNFNAEILSLGAGCFFARDQRALKL